MHNRDLWEKYMRVYDFLNDLGSYVNNLQDVAGELGACPGLRVLDAGSGTGNLSLILKRRGAEVLSCDFSRAALEQHRLKDPSACLLEVSLEQPLPIPTNAFDAVCCTSVLFTLTQAGCRQAVQEFCRVLRRGGRVIVTVGAPSAKVSVLAKMYWRTHVTRIGLIRGSLHVLCHASALAQVMWYNRQLRHLPDWQGFHLFSETELQDLFAAAGFVDIRIRRTFGNQFFLVTAVKPVGAALRAA